MSAIEQNRLVDFYVGRYTEKYGHKPKFNRNKGTWTFKVMLYDYDAKRIKALLEYFVDRYPEHDLDWFGYNYENVEEAMDSYDAAAEEIVELRKKSEVRTQEWLARKAAIVERVESDKRNAQEL